MLGMPRSKDPEKLLLDSLLGQRVATHIPEDIGKVSIGKQDCYDVTVSENQTDLGKAGSGNGRKRRHTFQLGISVFHQSVEDLKWERWGKGRQTDDWIKNLSLSRSKMGERTDDEGSVLLMRVSVLELLPDGTGCLRRTAEQKQRSRS